MPGITTITSPGRCEIPIGERECRKLLPTQSVGRIAFTERALPVIYPAHFVVDEDEIILAALPDGRVASAERGAIVAFEVDAYDPTTGQGWCVCTLGRSRLITDTAHLQALDALHFSPWASRADRRYIAVEISMLRGKRLADAPQPAP